MPKIKLNDKTKILSLVFIFIPLGIFFSFITQIITYFLIFSLAYNVTKYKNIEFNESLFYFIIAFKFLILGNLICFLVSFF